MADDDHETEEDRTEDDEAYGQNQYGGDSGDVDAVEQTERVREDDDADES